MSEPTHVCTLTIAIDWEYSRVIFMDRCTQCEEQQFELPLAHLPQLYGAIGSVLTELLGELPPLAPITSHQEFTDEEAAAHFRKGRH